MMVEDDTDIIFHSQTLRPKINKWKVQMFNRWTEELITPQITNQLNNRSLDQPIQLKHNKSSTETSDSHSTRHRPPSWKTDGLTEHPTYWKTTNQPDDEFTAIIQSNMRVTQCTKEANENLLSCRSLEMHSERSGKNMFSSCTVWLSSSM